MSHFLTELVQAQKRGEARGIPSICSSNPWVLKTALQAQGPILIESTCAQVNQFGGYSGMTPADFAAFVHNLALEQGIPLDQLILGGDHLGPHVWSKSPAEEAMHLSAEMVQAYVRAGYTKIHLDTSMKLGGDDPQHELDVEVAAGRTVQLARASEEAADPKRLPCYVIGTEVPRPGGALAGRHAAEPTQVEDIRRTLEVMEAAFHKAGLHSAWERVIAVVVQPGVEFGNDFILDYVPEAARELKSFIETTPLVYEAHSTDYQKRAALRQLVQDHFAILKVGPGLTFAFREAVFALCLIEKELYPPEERSGVEDALEKVMLEDPADWKSHYPGSPAEQAFARRYSLSDRIRYYWPRSEVQAALRKLLSNLKARPIPLPLLSQFAPIAFRRIREGELANSPESVLQAAIQAVLEDYRFACAPE